MGIEPAAAVPETAVLSVKLQGPVKVLVTLCPHQESNLDRRFRKPLFYPLNYESVVGETGLEPATSASRTQRASHLRYSPSFSLLF